MKTLNLNTSDNLLKLQSEINAVLESKIEAAKVNEALKSIDGFTLGEAKSLFESISDKLYQTPNGKKLIGRYANAIKENKDARKAYTVYSLIESPAYVSDANLFVTEAINEIGRIDKKHLSEGAKKVNSIIKECVKECGLSSSDIKTIFESRKDVSRDIDYLLSKKKGLSSLNEYVDTVTRVKSYINENMASAAPSERANLDCTLRESISSDFEAWENTVINDIMLAKLAGKDKSEIFEKYKNDCIDILSESIENSDSNEEKARFSTMKMQLEGKSYSEENAISDILKLSELRQTLSE